MSDSERYVSDGEDFSLVDGEWDEEEEEDDEELATKALERALNETLDKEWIPYEGPKGGEGWQNTNDPQDVRYQDNPPGEIADGYEEMAEGWGSQSLEELQAGIESEYPGVSVDISYGSFFFDGVSDDDVMLGDIEVEEEMRGEGIGSEVMTEIAAWADNTDTDIYLQTNQGGDTPEDDLIDWYESFGFETTDSDNYDVPNMHRQPDTEAVSTEFQEGWERVTTHYMMEEDRSEVQEEASEFLEENVGAENVDFRDFRPAHIREAGERVKALDDAHDLSDIDRLGDWGDLQNNFGVDFNETVGYFMADAGFNEDEVHVVAKSSSLGSPRSIGVDPEEWTVTNDRYQTVVHEIAHYLHFKEFKQREDSPRQAWDRYYDRLENEEEKVLEEEVSKYAATNAFEAVAEVATGIMYGKEFSDDVMAIYEEHGGPEVEDMGFEEVRWDEEPEDVTDLKNDKNPYLVEAEIVEESFRRWASSEGEAVDKAITKNWIPYRGPQGGEGWQNTKNPDDIRYDIEEPPGEVAAGYDEDHWERDNRAVAESDEELGYVSEDADGPSLNVATADEAESLAEAGASEGASSRHMHVATWRDPDGEVTNRAFVTNYGPDMERNRTGEKPLLGERAVAADSFLRNLGFGENLPKHFLNRQQRYLAVESSPGKEVRNAPDEWKDRVDEEKAKDFAAAVLIAGNSDLHSKNILLNEDGTFYAVDLDKSGGDFVDGPTRFKRRGVDSIKYALRDMGISMSRGEIGKRVEKVAQRYDPDDVLEGVPDSLWSDKDRHQFKENIRSNIEAAKEGRLL